MAHIGGSNPVLGEQSQLQQAAQKAQKGPGQAQADKPQTLAQAQASKGAKA